MRVRDEDGVEKLGGARHPGCPPSLKMRGHGADNLPRGPSGRLVVRGGGKRVGSTVSSSRQPRLKWPGGYLETYNIPERRLMSEYRGRLNNNSSERLQKGGIPGE